MLEKRKHWLENYFKMAAIGGDDLQSLIAGLLRSLNSINTGTITPGKSPMCG